VGRRVSVKTGRNVGSDICCKICEKSLSDWTSRHAAPRVIVCVRFGRTDSDAQSGHIFSPGRLSGIALGNTCLVGRLSEIIRPGGTDSHAVSS
jgi:hypothetical protein